MKGECFMICKFLLLITNLTLKTKIITTAQESLIIQIKNSSFTKNLYWTYYHFLTVRLYFKFKYLTCYLGTSRYTCTCYKLYYKLTFAFPLVLWDCFLLLCPGILCERDLYKSGSYTVVLKWITCNKTVFNRFSGGIDHMLWNICTGSK